jgi:hypothetical protein
MLFLFHRKGWELRPSSNYQLSAEDICCCPSPIDGFGTNESHPAGCFILARTVIMLKLRETLLARFLLPAIGVEARDGKPGPISSRLSGLGIERTSKGRILGEDGAIRLQIIGVGASHVHPEAKAHVANELDGANGFFNGAILLFGAIDFVLVDQHCSCAPFLTYGSIIHHSYTVYNRRKELCQRNDQASIVQNGKRSNYRSEEENLPIAELIRRALDAHLVWDDPTYAPHYPNPPQTRKGHSSPT